jgi:hypothetical protein
MSEAIHDFARLAANALSDITDPAALVNAADDALASLEQQCGSLRGPHRYAADAVANALYRLHSKQPRNPACDIENVVRWLDRACWWGALTPSFENGICVGQNLEHANVVIDGMASGLGALKELLRCTVGEVKRTLNERALERMHGGRRVAA